MRGIQLRSINYQDNYLCYTIDGLLYFFHLKKADYLIKWIFKEKNKKKLFGSHWSFRLVRERDAFIISFLSFKQVDSSSV